MQPARNLAVSFGESALEESRFDMSIRCHGCNNLVGSDNRPAGSRATCPTCGVELVIPGQLSQEDQGATSSMKTKKDWDKVLFCYSGWLVVCIALRFWGISQDLTHGQPPSNLITPSQSESAFIKNTPGGVLKGVLIPILVIGGIVFLVNACRLLKKYTKEKNKHLDEWGAGIMLLFVIPIALWVPSPFKPPIMREYTVKDGRLFPKHHAISVAQLPPEWEDHPRPTDKCILFFGRQDRKSHIGLHVYGVDEHGRDLKLVADTLIRDTPEIRRRVYGPPIIRRVGNKEGYYALDVAISKTKDPPPLMFEETVVLPLGNDAIVFTLHRMLSDDEVAEINLQGIWNALHLLREDRTVFDKLVDSFREEPK